MVRRHVVVVGRHHPRPGLLVRDGVVDRVLDEQRIVREVHLRDQPLSEGPPEDRKMDVRRPPGVVMVLPGVCPGPDRGEPVPALAVGDRAAQPGEVRIQRRRPLVADVPVPAAGVGLPHFEQGARHRAAVRVL